MHALLAPRRTTRRIGALFIMTLTATLAACGGGSGGDAPSPTQPIPETNPVGTYDLATVNGINTPAVIVNEVLDGTTLKGEITSGRIVVKTDGTWSYSIRGRWWTNGKLTSDKTSTSSGTWSMPSDGKLVMTSSATGNSFELLRTQFSLTEMKKVVENGVDATWPYVFVRP